MMHFSPVAEKEWNALAEKSPYAACFHCSAWKEAVLSSFGGDALLLTCKLEGRDWILPIFSGGRWSEGFRIGSIGYGGPLPLFSISKQTEVLREIRSIIENLEKELGKKCTGYTTFPSPLWEGTPLAVGELLSHTQILFLDSDPEFVFQKKIGGKVRTAIRRARKGGLSVRKIHAEEAPQAHGLLVETQKNVGAKYTTPYCFFQRLVERAGQGVETWGGFDASGQMVAAATMLYTEKSSFHLFHGWDRRQAPVGTNQALLWEMVVYSIQRGIREFNFGESPQESLKRAKEEWKTTPIPILKGVFV